ncbi:MAG: dihydrolipoamide acetyltransferase family protein [Spirochaetota bacterium]
MASEVLLPKQGNSVESCIIVEWKVAEGENVAEGDAIVEVETDKATMDVESTASGVLLRQLASEGDDVPVLTPIAVVGEAGEKVDDRTTGETATEGRSPASAEAPAAPSPTPARLESGPEAPAPSAPAPAARTHHGGAKISPRARRLAATKGVEFDSLTGSGPGGRIMVRDVEAALASRTAAPAPTGGTRGEGERSPGATGGRVESGIGPARATSETRIKGVRKIIAERMHASIVSTAQLTMDASADARAILAYRGRLKESDAEHLQAISINHLVLYAVSRVLRDNPALNATFTDETIRTYDQVDLAFAVDTPRGLMVPVIRGAERRSLVGLTQEAQRLAKGCLEGGINPDELAGGTFTVTNLGAYGIERFTPVLNTPQVGILGVCSITPRPAPDGEGTIPMMGLSLTIDHQVVDGAPAARFLSDVGRAIEQIDLTLAE